MKIAFSYIRFSSREQRKGDSLDRQLSIAREYCARNGLTLDESLKRDDGYSAYKGAHIKKGSLGDFLQRVKDGEISTGTALVIENLDRLSRQGIRVTRQLLEQLTDAGIDVHIVSINRVFRTGSENELTDYIVLGVEAERAYKESKYKSDRLFSAWGSKKARASNGKAITSRVPYWLVATKGELIREVQDRSNAVRRIFELAALGYGARRIANQLTEEGLPAFGHESWTLSYVKKILNNRAVLGEFQPFKRTTAGRVPDGQPINGYFPTVVTQTEWDAAHSAIKAKIANVKPGSRYRGGGRPSVRVNNLFTGLVFDATGGGRPLNYHYKGRGANDWEYLVTAYKPGQPSHKIRYDHFEKAFLAYLGDLDWRAVSNEAEPAELKVLTGRLNDVRSELDRTERAVARNQKLIDSAEEVPLSLFSAQDKAQARLIELQAERSRLEAEAERIKSRSSVIDHPEELLAAIQSRDGSNDTRLRLRAEIRRRVSRIDVSFVAQIITSTGEPILNLQPGLANAVIRIAFTNDLTRIVVFQGENKILLS